MQLTSFKTLEEMTRPRPRRISVEALRRMAVTEARKQGARRQNQGLDFTGAWAKWLGEPRIRPYFLVDNPIGLTREGAIGVRDAFRQAFEAAQAQGLA